MVLDFKDTSLVSTNNVQAPSPRQFFVLVKLVKQIIFVTSFNTFQASELLKVTLHIDSHTLAKRNPAHPGPPFRPPCRPQLVCPLFSVSILTHFCDHDDDGRMNPIHNNSSYTARCCSSLIQSHSSSGASWATSTGTDVAITFVLFSGTEAVLTVVTQPWMITFKPGSRYSVDKQLQETGCDNAYSDHSTNNGT
ncbi:MAG TPA: hypothetical protein VGO47_14365 [Chlamydiales bacterium]|nr:hypothetical protein [Chlamydiales bacterium]